MVQPDGRGGMSRLELAAAADLVGVFGEPLNGQLVGALTIGLTHRGPIVLVLLGLDEQQYVTHGPIVPQARAAMQRARDRRATGSARPCRRAAPAPARTSRVHGSRCSAPRQESRR